jgi:fructokinase
VSGALLYGLILFDIIEGEKYIGGPAINIALHMACHGHESTLVSCVGGDELGQISKDILRQNGISSDFVVTDTKYETGWVNVFLDDNGNPSFEIIKPVAYDFIALTDQQLENLSQNEFEIFYFGTVVQRGSVSAETLKQLIKQTKFKEVFFDINLRPGHYTKEVVDFSLSKTNIFKLNEEELNLIGDLFGVKEKDESKLINWVFEAYPDIKTILLTRGKNGATVFTPEVRKDIEGIHVEVKDTVGSGDAFSAGFIMDYVKSGDIFAAAQKGNELGAYVATKSGAVPEINDENFRQK